MEILKLKPATKDYLWGGNKLRSEYFKESKDEKIAETWELSAHEDGLSTIQSGVFKDQSFNQYLEKYGNSVIGKEYDKDRFPILIKFIDALKPLSIQVHPNDDYALKNEGDYGKTEMWYVLEAEKNAFIYYGVKEDISKEEFRKAIENNNIEEKLNKVYVKPGDCFLIESGTIHAIGAGIVICEIQQNSNITYRVYDYNRKDKNGNTRELHIDKAVKVANLKVNPVYNFNNKNHINSQLERLAKSKYFDVLKGNCNNGSLKLQISDKSFQALNIISGEGQIVFQNKTYHFKKGDTFFVPAQNDMYEIIGNCRFIISTLPV